MSKHSYAIIALLIIFLLACLGSGTYFVLSNRQAVQQFQAAEKLMAAGDPKSIETAQKLYLACLAADVNNEMTYVRLAEIAELQKNPPDVAFFWLKAYQLNPLVPAYVDKCVNALSTTRNFHQLEHLLSNLPVKNQRHKELLTYAAFHNGNANLYADMQKRLLKKKNSDLPQLTKFLSEADKLTLEKYQKQLEKFCKSTNQFVAYEARLALANSQTNPKQLDEAEKNLSECARLNFYATAPTLASFLAFFRSFAKAIPVYEDFLKIHQDPFQAMRLGELLALSNKMDRLKELLETYKQIHTKDAALACYYLEALIALATENIKDLETAIQPLRYKLSSPLLRYMQVCVDIDANDAEAVNISFRTFIESPSILDFHKRGCQLATQFLVKQLKKSILNTPLLELATQLNEHYPQLLTEKIVLMEHHRQNIISEAELQKARSLYPLDKDIWKLEIDYQMRWSPDKADRLIRDFKKQFPKESTQMISYELLRSFQRRDLDQVSELFRKNLAPQYLNDYWSFSVATERQEDLKTILEYPEAKTFHPFCQAELHLLNGRVDEAMDLLATAKCDGNLMLLFHAARRLAMNNRYEDALRRYAEFPPNSIYAKTILLNTSEILAEINRLDEAVDKARQAWLEDSQNPATQFCYADKLKRAGRTKDILNVIPVLDPNNPFKKQLQDLWIAGVQASMKDNLERKNYFKVRSLIRSLKLYDPKNPLIEEYQRQLPPPTSPKKKKAEAATTAPKKAKATSAGTVPKTKPAK